MEEQPDVHCVRRYSADRALTTNQTASAGITTKAALGRISTRIAPIAVTTHAVLDLETRTGWANQRAARMIEIRSSRPASVASSAPHSAHADAAIPTIATIPRPGRIDEDEDVWDVEPGTDARYRLPNEPPGPGPTLAQPMPIDIDIAHVARLARLSLTDEERDRYAEQLGVILEHAAKVQAVDTEGVDPTAHPLGLVNRYRTDEARPSLDRATVLGQAPEARDGYFVVPPALEGS